MKTIPVFCGRTEHVGDCCMASPDQLGPHEAGPLLNAEGLVQRQPTAEEIQMLQRDFYTELFTAGEIAETTYHKLCTFTDHYVPLLDPAWWDDEDGGS